MRVLSESVLSESVLTESGPATLSGGRLPLAATPTAPAKARVRESVALRRRGPAATAHTADGLRC